MCIHPMSVWNVWVGFLGGWLGKQSPQCKARICVKAAGILARVFLGCQMQFSNSARSLPARNFMFRRCGTFYGSVENKFSKYEQKIKKRTTLNYAKCKLEMDFRRGGQGQESTGGNWKDKLLNRVFVWGFKDILMVFWYSKKSNQLFMVSF